MKKPWKFWVGVVSAVNKARPSKPRRSFAEWLGTLKFNMGHIVLPWKFWIVMSALLVGVFITLVLVAYGVFLLLMGVYQMLLT